MKYEIDQSGKVEQTNKNTILCLSNGDGMLYLFKQKLNDNFRKSFEEMDKFVTMFYINNVCTDILWL